MLGDGRLPKDSWFSLAGLGFLAGEAGSAHGPPRVP